MVKGTSLEDVKRELSQAIQSYLESLDKENIKDLFPRPAPLSSQIDYYYVCFIVKLFHVVKKIRTGFETFCEVATPKGFQVLHCA
jgi:predicted RNase H-like HicB family nuclease